MVGDPGESVGDEYELFLTEEHSLQHAVAQASHGGARIHESKKRAPGLQLERPWIYELATEEERSEQERVLRLSRRERESEILEWHLSRERAGGKSFSVPLQVVWGKLFAYGVNVLRCTIPSDRLSAVAFREEKSFIQLERPSKFQRTEGRRGSEVTGVYDDSLVDLSAVTTEGVQGGKKLCEKVGSLRLSPAPLSNSCKAVLNAVVSRVSSPFQGSFGGADQSPILYEWTKEAITRHLCDQVAPSLRGSLQRGLEFINEANLARDDFLKFTKSMWMIFNPLDRNCCLERKLPTITSVALRLFRDHVFAGDVQRRLLISILHVVRVMRQRASEEPPDPNALAKLINSEFGTPPNANETGEGTIESFALWDCVAIFVAMGIASQTGLQSVSEVLTRLNEVRRCALNSAYLTQLTLSGDILSDIKLYIDDFEPVFLEDSRAFFKSMADVWLRQYDVLSFLTRVAHMFRRENLFAHTHLFGFTRVRLCALFVEETAVKNSAWLLNQARAILERVLAEAETTDIVLTAADSAALRSIYGMAKLMTEVVSCMALPQGPGMARGHLPEDAFSDLFRDLTITFKKIVASRGEAVLRARIDESVRLAEELKQWAKGPRQTQAPHRPSAHDPEFIESLLQLMRNGKMLCQQLFDCDELFCRSLSESLDDCVNGKGFERPTSVEMLAAYSHRMLRKGGFKRAGGQEAMTSELREIVEIFALLRAKDLFEETYRSLLSERILSKTMVSMELESFMLAEIKIIQGPAFITKMESMLSDCLLADEMVEHFRRWAESEKGGASGIETTDTNTADCVATAVGESLTTEVRVVRICAFTLASWPSTGLDELSVLLPREVSPTVDQFNKFYASSYPGRRLRWIYARGDMEVKVSVGKQSSYIVSASTLQGIVMAAFDDESGPITIQTLAKRTGLTDRDVLRTVLSSLCLPLAPKEPRSRLLLRCNASDSSSLYDLNDFPGTGLDSTNPSQSQSQSQSQSLSGSTCTPQQPEEEFRGNPEFASRSRRLAAKPPLFLFDNPSDSIKESLLRNRVFQLEASIVRVMKSRKTLQHSELVFLVEQELASQFAPSAADIKKRVESLIDRDYLERTIGTEPNNSTLVYIA